jgi:hypothetical protein
MPKAMAWRMLVRKLRGLIGKPLLGPRYRQLALEAVVALSVAVLVWLYTRGRAQTALDDVPIPVQVTLASGTAGNWQLDVQGPCRVPVSFSGPPSRIRELRQQIQRGLVQVAIAFSVPEEHQKDSTYRDRIRVEADLIPTPPGVQTVVAEGRNTIPVTLHRLVERHLPVRLDYAGELRISSIKMEPASVVVRGPKEILDRARHIATQPYTLPSPQSEISSELVARGQVSLLAEIDGHPVQCLPDSVALRLRAHPRQKTYELTDVPIHFLCPPEFTWRPRFGSLAAGKVTVKMVGPAADETPTVLAFVDLTHADLGRGRNVEPLRLQLPKDFQLVQDAPQLVSFYLDPIDPRSE